VEFEFCTERRLASLDEYAVRHARGGLPPDQDTERPLRTSGASFSMEITVFETFGGG